MQSPLPLNLPILSPLKTKKSQYLVRRQYGRNRMNCPSLLSPSLFLDLFISPASLPFPPSPTFTWKCQFLWSRMLCADCRCRSGSKRVQWAGPCDMQRSDSAWGCGGWKSGSATANMLLQSYITNAWAAPLRAVRVCTWFRVWVSWLSLRVCGLYLVFWIMELKASREKK